MQRAARSILYGQIVLYAGLLVCALIRPDGLSANDGTSYFGIYLNTFWPYAAGILGSTYFCWQAANRLAKSKLRPIRLTLLAMVPLMVIVVFTPYSAGRVVEDTHTTAGAILFILQLLLSGWLIWRLRYAWWTITLTLTELAAGILSFIYLTPKAGLLFQTQVLFQMAFGVLLIRSLQVLLRPRTKSD